MAVATAIPFRDWRAESTTLFASLVLLLLATVAMPTGVDAGGMLSAAGLPCVFEGHLRTDKNWYGYLANISVVTTARMTFEFSYAADRCCQNILFYTEDQTSIISARMNCWQKEYLLRPEDDQILRLTPRFSWSGCHMTHPGGLPTYQCEGGRSFTVEQPQLPSLAQSGGHQPGGGGGGAGSSGVGGSSSTFTRPSAWYIAASNCAALNGLDLRYRLVVYGHVGDCPTTSSISGSGRTSSSSFPNSMRSSLALQNDGTAASASLSGSDGTGDGSSTAASASLSGSDGTGDGSSTAATVCRLDGEINTTATWYGFLANMTLVRGGGFRFRFRYQALSSTHFVRVLLYRVEDLAKLSAEQTCWQKDGIIRQRNEPEQVIDLSAQSSWNGCISTGLHEVSCQGERRYDEPRRLHVAVSDCHGGGSGLGRGIQLGYQLEVHGFTNADELCSGTIDRRTTLSSSVVVVVAVAMTSSLFGR